jgi:hypothetical protein
VLMLVHLVQHIKEHKLNVLTIWVLITLNIVGEPQLQLLVHVQLENVQIKQQHQILNVIISCYQ